MNYKNLLSLSLAKRTYISLIASLVSQNETLLQGIYFENTRNSILILFKQKQSGTLTRSTKRIILPKSDYPIFASELKRDFPDLKISGI